MILNRAQIKNLAKESDKQVSKGFLQALDYEVYQLFLGSLRISGSHRRILDRDFFTFKKIRKS